MPVRVRMGLHAGAAQQRDGDYFGVPLNRVARLCAAGHGGQVLLSLAAQELVRDQLPTGVSLRDLGEQRLKDLARPERVFQVVAPELMADFPPLRTLESYRAFFGAEPPADSVASVKTDQLAPLLELADVPAAVATARERVDQALRHPALRRHGGQVAAEAGLRSAVSSAALEGHSHDLESVRAGTVTDPVLQGALRVAGALPGLADLWPRAPRQALAKLHVLAARGAVGEAELGRPVASAAVAERLDALATLVSGGTSVPPVLLAECWCDLHDIAAKGTGFEPEWQKKACP